MELHKFPHPSLFKKTTEVKVFGNELKYLLDAMWEIMQGNRGMGLSANQVGLDMRMFVMNSPEGRLNIINPVIVNRSLVTLRKEEGCLSAPGEFIIVPNRSEWVQIHYEDENGDENKGFFSDMYSICVQHEMEHLNGEGFMQNKSISKSERKRLAKKWNLK